jgi:hypothetical protein
MQNAKAKAVVRSITTVSKEVEQKVVCADLLMPTLGIATRYPNPRATAHPEGIARRDAGEALVHIARSYNVSHPTISRLRG